MDRVKYPELARLMAEFGVSKKKLSEIIGVTPAAITGKMSGNADFRVKEAAIITAYFKKSKPDIDMEKIFAA